jgi:hypothetical protein
MDDAAEPGAYLPLPFKRHIAAGSRRCFSHYTHALAGLHGTSPIPIGSALSQVLVPVQEKSLTRCEQRRILRCNTPEPENNSSWRAR